MAENQDGMEKSQQPTSRRKTKARREGNVASSKELPAAISLLCVSVFFYFFGPHIFTSLGRVMREYFMMTNFEINVETTPTLFMFGLEETTKIMAPFFFLLLLIGIAVNIYMVGWVISTKALKLKFNKLNPFTGFGKFFKLKSLVELAKSVFKIFVIGYLAYYIVVGKLSLITSMADMDFYDILKEISLILFEIMWKISVLVLIMAIIDYKYQKWQHNKDLMMTKQEVREERKQMEGDPHIKGKIRQLQRDMARQRMMESVPQSDVVVTNPTHYAVALRYSPGEDRAPVVLAKGQRLIALRIKEIAKKNGVHIHEAPPLARSLFKTVDIGDEIPENLYKAVAEILTLVDKFKKPA